MIRIPPMQRHWSDVEMAAWSDAHPIGTRVRYWPARNGDEFVDTTVMSRPWRLGHGAPVVQLDRVRGCLALDHIAKLPEIVDTDALWRAQAFPAADGKVLHGMALRDAWIEMRGAAGKLQSTTRLAATETCQDAPAHVGAALTAFYAATKTLSVDEKRAVIVELARMAALERLETPEND